MKGSVYELFADVKDGIQWLIHQFRKDQNSDGSWNYPFESGLITDIYTIILLRTLELKDENLVKGLTKRILNKQDTTGAWKLFPDETYGNLSATVEAYYALLYSGYVTPDDSRLQIAKDFIKENGGIEKCNMFTKTMLALTGQYEWPSFSPLPVEFILLPLSFPINFYQISVFGRVNIAPIMIVADKKFSIKTKDSPDLSDLLSQRDDNNWLFDPQMRSFFSTLKNSIENLIGLPEKLHLLAIERAKKYMLERIEEDGTLYSYFSSTFLMIFALLSLGYTKNDPVIIKAVDGILSMKTEINGIPHIQYTTASVWNTSLISFALQEAGISINDPMVAKANQYLLKKQHNKFGDWVLHNPKSKPGGWGFSNINTMNPDIDDTTASLRSLARGVNKYDIYQKAWNRGMTWLLSMQNDDGGWGSFEKNVGNQLLSFFPIEKAEFLLTDPSTTDLTGRTLEFLGHYTTVSKNHESIKQGVKWLIKNQEADGSWYGRWGICYLYGTWGAVTGLIAAGISSYHPSIQKAVTWLTKIQHSDGGWGESCYSDIQKKYAPLGESTLTQTAWALDALIAASTKPTNTIQKGIAFLLHHLETDDWTTDYPKGQGLAGGFYIHYHCYRYLFPLLTLVHYQEKFGGLIEKASL
ncbi:MAG: squalene--hopene cyclase [Bacillota bacterium]|nr:squalene--hopene cyclase [Bacillota bacterium]